MLFTKKKRKKQSQGATKVFMLGRPLLVVDYDLQDIRFIRRSQIPLGSPTHFFSLEPFTILGINPRVSYADITNTAIAKADIYCSSLPDKDEYAREKEALRNAVNILGNQQSCIQYRSFARKYDQSRQMLSGSKMERRFAKAIIGHAPGLRKLQTIRNSKSGGILAVSLLVSLVLLIVVLTIPVGGVAIFGFTFFASTLIAAWGPLAILPVVALVGLGGLGAYWYKQHKDVFVELQGYLGQILDYMEAMAYSVEDIFLMQGFRLFQRDPTAYRFDQERIQKTRDEFISDFVEKYVEAFVDRLSSMITEREIDENMNPEQFFEFLADNPGEVQQCFLLALSELMIEKRTTFYQLEAEIKKGV